MIGVRTDMDWYVIHTYSGFEARVKSSIEERANSAGFKDMIGQVLVPTEEVVEIKEGKKRVSTKKFFPGYVLVEMDLTDQTWQLIKSTAKVTGFLGGDAKPAPLTLEEVQTLKKQIDSGTAIPREKLKFQKTDAVRIIDGPFMGFNGVIDEINPDHQKLKVLVSIFGRSTPVELNFLQVERL
jgi:transcription termination/antitermination protein NusG